MLRSISHLSYLWCLANVLVSTAHANAAHFTAASFVTPAGSKRDGGATSVFLPASRLNAKKAPVNTATKKIQVKLLKHIVGTGQAGQGTWNAFSVAFFVEPHQPHALVFNFCSYYGDTSLL